jgi:hypothetical protein
MKKSIWLIILLVIVFIGYFIVKELTKPLPGEVVEDVGREHVTDIFGVKYSSNPPTSGPHFAVWAKPGVYDRLISDGHFIHSMEHGYIVIWYDCDKIKTGFLLKEALAHDEPAEESTDSGQLLMHMKVVPQGDMSWFTPENPPEVEVELPESFKGGSCTSLARELSEFTKVAKRVIVTPRLNLDNLIAITAWGRIEKLDSVDKEKIEAFIKAYHNKGPEQTVE